MSFSAFKSLFYSRFFNTLRNIGDIGSTSILTTCTMATHDVRNWLKLNLLLDRACLVLRQLFQKSWKTRFGREWSGTQDDINIMLSQRQMKNIGKMLRKTILSGDVNSWDLTTLRAILTSKGFLNLTAKEISNINCIGNIRNQLAHSASKGIPDDELDVHWRAVSDTLVQFGESEADLELLKQESRVGGVEFIKKEEPINDESVLEARRLRDAGNTQFQSENLAKSIKIYTQAILLPGLPSADRATLYSNRSIAYLKQKKLNLALDDAKKSVELWPEWWRGHYRMGHIYTEMTKYKKAQVCFDKAFAREPQREEIKEARSYARMKGGQLERNDAIDAHFVFQTIDDVISENERRTGCQINADAMKKLLHTNVKNDFIRNWQDCQRGNSCQTGADGYPRDYVIAAQYYKKAADRGSAEGLFLLAMFTMEGKGLKRDIQLGIRMLKQAAEKPPILYDLVNFGVAEAEHTLGLCYQNGIGVTKNVSAAMDWYQKACEHGSVTAANNMGLLYLKKGNHVKAEQHLKMASNAGYAKAMANLAGYYCLEGNADLALTWCQRARNSGESYTYIDHIEKMSENAILEFKAIGVEEWELKNMKEATGLSMRDRLGRFLCQSDPYNADCHKLMGEFVNQLPKNKDEPYSNVVRFPPDQLEKYVKRSLYARELRRAQKHFLTAIAAMIALGHCSDSPMPLYEEFITELSSCAKIDFIVAAHSMEWRQQARYLVDHLLTLKTTFLEETRICYAALNGLSSQESSVTFLNECIRKYPHNAYFIKTRGKLYAFLERYEDGIRDINASIKLEPCMYECLYYRAAMMRLFHPNVSAEEVISAYKDFVAAAPEDHRKIPESYYAMAEKHLSLARASLNSNKLHKMNFSAGQHFFDLGVEAERKQLPFFLPYQSTAKACAELMIKAKRIHELHSKQQSGVSKITKTQYAKPVEVNELERPRRSKQQKHKAVKSTTKRKGRAFWSALSNPSREKVLKTHRKLVSIFSETVLSDRRIQYFSFKPTKDQKSASSLIGLHAITLNEMDYRQDKIYNGYVLTVTIIEHIAFLTSMQTIIQDSSGEVLRCAIYNWPHAVDRVKARKEFGIGCKISIINPYMRIAMDGQSMIRVDDPKSIIFHGFLEKMCRYCCEPNANKSCAKCKANYCDKKCKLLDWKRDHKLICGGGGSSSNSLFLTNWYRNGYIVTTLFLFLVVLLNILVHYKHKTEMNNKK